MSIYLVVCVHGCVAIPKEFWRFPIHSATSYIYCVILHLILIFFTKSTLVLYIVYSGMKLKIPSRTRDVDMSSTNHGESSMRAFGDTALLNFYRSKMPLNHDLWLIGK